MGGREEGRSSVGGESESPLSRLFRREFVSFFGLPHPHPHDHWHRIASLHLPFFSSFLFSIPYHSVIRIRTCIYITRIFLDRPSVRPSVRLVLVLVLSHPSAFLHTHIHTGSGRLLSRLLHVLLPLPCPPCLSKSPPLLHE